MFNSRWAGGAAALAIAASLAPTTVLAQEITSTIRGSVVSSTGAPVGGATVSVVNTETGFARTATTSSNGSFNLRGLGVTGSYTVTVTAPGFEGGRFENIRLAIGQDATLNFELSSGSSDEIIVRATRPAGIETAVGPNAVFSLDDLNNVPAINRDIRDVLRQDPRVFISEADNDQVQCAGQNPRFNSLTVDGVRLNDGFGLNSNGYPTQRQPFPFDAIEQIAVELAPFDVQYGGFSACNINAVTKSGTNSFSGTLFVDYTDDSLTGDSLEGDSLTIPEFDEKRYGFQVAGPIIQDKLFFSVAYEKLEGSDVVGAGVDGSGAFNETSGLSQAQLDEILRISNDIYGYNPGGVPASYDNEDEKYLVKLDWNITDRHRAAFTYNYNEGFNIAESDGDPDEFEFENHLYERGATLTNTVVQLFSDWTDNFSTELRFGYVDLNNDQISLNGDDFGEITIELENDPFDFGDNVDVYLGTDDSRQANFLDYEIYQFAAKGFYNVGDHQVSFGFEREETQVFNVFVQHVDTEIDFERIRIADTTTYVDTDSDGRVDPDEPGVTTISPIRAFELGFAENVDYNNAPSQNPLDAAADWAFAANTLFIQDDWQLTPALGVTLGLRYDFYTSDDAPEENAEFTQEYGFSNAQNFDGEGLIQPRIAFTYEAKDNLTIRGGVGRFSGGNPNVWLSNNYSNNNVLQFGQSGRSVGLEVREDGIFYDGSSLDPNVEADLIAILDSSATSLFDPSVNYVLNEDGTPAAPGYGVPEGLTELVADGQGFNFQINYIDPDFTIPSEWKFSLGATYVPEVGLPGFLGGEYTLTGDVLYSHGENSAIVIRGDLVEAGTDANGFVVYESRVDSNGDPVQESFELTNSDGDANSTFVVSGAVAKEYDNGVSWNLGYAYSDAQDVNPMTSAVAFSNFVNRTWDAPNTNSAATSNYNIRHRFTGRLDYRNAFFGDYDTKLSLFGTANSGRPYTVVLPRDLDPYDDDPADVSGNTIAPGFERNGEEGSWFAKVDLRLAQEFPGILDGHKTEAFIIVENFTNLLNDEWGVLNQRGFPGRATAEGDFTTGFTAPSADNVEFRDTGASAYAIRFGVRYDF